MKVGLNVTIVERRQLLWLLRVERSVLSKLRAHDSSVVIIVLCQPVVAARSLLLGEASGVASDL